MSTCQEGLYGSLSYNGTTIALLSEVDFKMKRNSKRWYPMGSVDASDVLLGAVTYDVTAKHAYIDNTYLGFIKGGSAMLGTFFPRGGASPTIAGTMVCTDSGVGGVKAEAADPVMEDLTFIMYGVTHA